MASTIPAELKEIREAIDNRDAQLHDLLKEPGLRSDLSEQIRHARVVLDDAYGFLVAAENIARRYGPKTRAA